MSCAGGAPALAAAMKRGTPVIPVYIWAPAAASKLWLRRSLAALCAELQKRGSRLIVRLGPTEDALRRLAAETGAGAAFCNRRHEPGAVARGSKVEWCLRDQRLLAKFPPSPRSWPHSLPLSELQSEPARAWASGFRDVWQPGEAGVIADYATNRNTPDMAGTSRLSPYLQFGQISPGQVWRKFAHYLLFHFPESPHKPSRWEFAAFPWKPKARLLKAWTHGKTGYSLVDAGMRELWRTGWMHNRVTMGVASFLAKHLLIGWQGGAFWFWDTFMNADLANNTFGWQWIAGCGADPSPYFRIFNPGSTYPPPIADHDEARRRALAALESIRKR